MGPETVLALMLAIMPPGKTIYSQVEVPEGSPRACTEATLLCAEPRFDRELSVWLRPETAEEGLLRYWTIARAVSDTAQDDDMARLMLAVTFHESGWRRDVHSGIGNFARGDRGKSWCLGQIMLGESGRKTVKQGWSARELVGLDLESTKRCLTVAGDHLERSRMACRKGKVEQGPGCEFAVYGGGGLPVNDRRLRERAATLARLRGLKAATLSPETKRRISL